MTKYSAPRRDFILFVFTAALERPSIEILSEWQIGGQDSIAQGLIPRDGGAFAYTFTFDRTEKKSQPLVADFFFLFCQKPSYKRSLFD